MSPSGHLCVLTILGLFLPTRDLGGCFRRAGLEPFLLSILRFPSKKNLLSLVWPGDAAHLEVQSDALTLTQPSDHKETEAQDNFPKTSQQVGYTTKANMETKTQHPTVTVPASQTSSDEATASARPTEDTKVFSQRPTPDRHPWLYNPHLGKTGDDRTPRPPGPDENSPFFYDEATLRKRGLLVAAVLFITGIIILTSGKCRHLSRFCQTRGRTYRVVNTGSHEPEDMMRVDMGRGQP
ncbi:FXYD domain-containing ion transport regulator 5 [Ctenodactylus gundi]